jgi:hypothetical protein
MCIAVCIDCLEEIEGFHREVVVVILFRRTVEEVAE